MPRLDPALLSVMDPDGTRDERSRALSEADALKRRFNESFWMPDEEFYALALDGDGERIAARASNIGHCFGTGILDPDKIRGTVEGLMSEDLFSGWGIRTLSARNPAYDPFSYHRGAIWPVENAFIASGMRDVGYHEEAERITAAQLSTAALFQHMRLPEVLSGHPRTVEDPSPGVYSFANLLQAWSISGIAQHVQAILGIRPRADEGALYLDPHLPAWIDWLEIDHLKVGSGDLSIRFEREPSGRTRWKLIGSAGPIEVRSGLPPKFADFGDVEVLRRNSR